jgi:hypothetical protein
MEYVWKATTPTILVAFAVLEDEIGAEARWQDILARVHQVDAVPDRGYVEHVAPDVTACVYWLKNRDPARWRDAWQVEHALGSSPTGRCRRSGGSESEQKKST